MAYLCRICGRTFPPSGATGVPPVCEDCELPTVPIDEQIRGATGPARVALEPSASDRASVPPAAPAPAGSPREALKPPAPEPRREERKLPFIPAAKGREASDKRPRLPPPSRRGLLGSLAASPLSVLVPANLLFVLLVAVGPAFLLFGRMEDLEERLDPSGEESSAAASADLANLSSRIDALEKQLEEGSRRGAGDEAGQIAMLAEAEKAVLHIEQSRIVAEGVHRFTLRKAGSGFLFEDGGWALTNFHVVDGHEDLVATLHDGTEVKVKVMGQDPPSDIALVRVVDFDRLGSARTIRPLVLGESSTLSRGQRVYALGSPKNLVGSVARGIVSNPRRYQPSLILAASGTNAGLFNNWVQTDAPINRGNSGGPLVDGEGRVVGVVTRKMNEAENIAFAIPVDYVKGLIGALKRDGSVRRSMIGAVFASWRPQDSIQESGVKIRAVHAGSPAEIAGVRPGDVFNAIGDLDLAAPFEHDIPDARNRVAALSPGVPIKLSLTRDRTRMVLSITPRASEEIDDLFFFFEHLGASIAPIDPNLRRLYGAKAKEGLWVGAVETGGRFDHAGIQPGDALSLVGGEPAKKLATLKKLLDQVEARAISQFEVEVVRDGTSFTRTLQFHVMDDE